MTWDKQPTHCPACVAPIPPDSAECAACGCVFAKWNAKAAREQLGERRERELTAESRYQPASDLPAPAPEPGSWPKRLLALALLAGASGAAWWLFAPGSSSPPPEKLEAAGEAPFSFVAPSGWTVESRDPRCKDQGCVIASYRLEGPRGRVNPSLQARVLDQPPGRPREELVEELKAGLKGGYDSYQDARSEELLVDGLPAVRVEASGLKHLKLKTQDEVAMNAQAYLAQTGKSSVMARYDPTGRNPTAYVVTQEAQYAEIDARKVDGVVLVPLRRKQLRLSYEYDQADAVVGEAAVKDFLEGVRVAGPARSRPYDRLGRRSGPVLSALAAAALAALALLVF